MPELIVKIAEWMGIILILYFILLNTFYLLQGLFSVNMLKRYFRQIRAEDNIGLTHEANLPPVSILVPSYNEEKNCCDTIEALLELNYPNYEVILINDGSTDQTLACLNAHFQLKPALHINVSKLSTAPIKEVYHSALDPRIWVIDKENGGKADALNAGINYCNSPYFCAVDADTLLEKDALTRIVFPFLLNLHTVAVGGIIKVLNGCRVENRRVTDIRMPNNPLAALQVVEYLRSFLSGRMSWNLFNGSLIISGAFGVFRHATVLDAGGYDCDTVGEDMELVVRLHRHCATHDPDYKITFIPDPVAWTQCPEHLSGLYAQRERWQRGLVQTLFKHIGMMFNPRYGKIGLISYPYFFLMEMLGPLIEVMGYLAFVVLFLAGRISWHFALLFFMAAFGMGLMVSLLSLILQEMNTRRFGHNSDLLKLAAYAILENFGYRQLLSFWRVVGTLMALKGKRSWGQIKRRRFNKLARSVEIKPG